jgi:hypothetical protein
MFANKALLVLSVFVTSLGVAVKDDNFRKIDNKAFKEGEKLTFDVNYGFVTAGIAVMEITRVKRISGRKAYNVVFTVNTVPSFDWIFKVRDRYETYIDVEGLFPWRFEQHIREGSFSRDFSAFFDQRRQKAKTSSGEYEVPEYVNDILSAFYLARTFDYSNLKISDMILMQNFYKDKVYDLNVKYLGKDRISVEAGTFDCVVVEPLVQEGGLFKSEGSIIVWLTDDDLRVPVRVKTKVVIGSIDSELTKYEGLAGKLTSKR